MKCKLKYELKIILGYDNFITKEFEDIKELKLVMLRLLDNNEKIILIKDIYLYTDKILYFFIQMVNYTGEYYDNFDNYEDMHGEIIERETILFEDLK